MHRISDSIVLCLFSHTYCLLIFLSLSQDIILVAIGAAGYLAGAAALATYVGEWRNAADANPSIRSTITRVADASAAAAVSH